METCLGSRVTEYDPARQRPHGGCWFTVNNKTYDLACTEEHGGGMGRLHHVTYATDQREDILRAADIFLENGVHIETGPHKHAIQGTFFLYVWEPAGNRIELANAGARLILDPDWEPVVLDGGGPQEGPGLGAENHRDVPHPRHAAGPDSMAKKEVTASSSMSSIRRL
jgi:catechol 2,3-dioxygenase